MQDFDSVMIDKLQTLLLETDRVLAKIMKKVSSETNRLYETNIRIRQCQDKIKSLKGSSKANRACSASKFPRRLSQELPLLTCPSISCAINLNPTKILKTAQNEMNSFERLTTIRPYYELYSSLQYSLKRGSTRAEFIMEEEGLGNVPSSLATVGSSLLFNTANNPYQTFLSPTNNLMYTDRISEQESTTCNNSSVVLRSISQAPSSITIPMALPDTARLNLSYQPSVSTVTPLVLPNHLPLNQLADCYDYVAAELANNPAALETVDGNPPPAIEPSMKLIQKMSISESRIIESNTISTAAEDEKDKEIMSYQEHTLYSKYFKMLKVGIPMEVVKDKMRIDGVDESVLVVEDTNEIEVRKEVTCIPLERNESAEESNKMPQHANTSDEPAKVETLLTDSRSTVAVRSPLLDAIHAASKSALKPTADRVMLNSPVMANPKSALLDSIREASHRKLKPSTERVIVDEGKEFVGSGRVGQKKLSMMDEMRERMARRNRALSGKKDDVMSPSGNIKISMAKERHIVDTLAESTVVAAGPISVLNGSDAAVSRLIKIAQSKSIEERGRRKKNLENDGSSDDESRESDGSSDDGDWN